MKQTTDWKKIFAKQKMSNNKLTPKMYKEFSKFNIQKANKIFRMDKSFGQVFHHTNKYTDGKYMHEKILNIIVIRGMQIKITKQN